MFIWSKRRVLHGLLLDESDDVSLSMEGLVFVIWRERGTGEPVKEVKALARANVVSSANRRWMCDVVMV